MKRITDFFTSKNSNSNKKPIESKRTKVTDVNDEDCTIQAGTSGTCANQTETCSNPTRTCVHQTNILETTSNSDSNICNEMEDSDVTKNLDGKKAHSSTIASSVSSSEREPEPSTSAENSTVSLSPASGDIGTTGSHEHENEYLKHVQVNGRHHVVCIPCSSYPEIVKLFLPSQNKKLPSIAQQDCGTRYRGDTVSSHFETTYHQKAAEKYRLASLGISATEKLQSSEIGKIISKQNEELANKIGMLLFHVYCDAKKLTLSAYSFPSRIIASHLGTKFSFNSDTNSAEEMKNFNFQYITPASHLELLTCIVKNHRNPISSLLQNSLAVSLRADGSVDRTQIDKIYVLAKCVTNDGEVKDLFLGAAEPKKRGAEGLLGAIEDALKCTLEDSEAVGQIFYKTSSLVTDGAAVNKGDKNGLWALYKNKYKKESGKKSSVPAPLVTFWCAVHRSGLVWKQVTKEVSEVDHLISTLSAITTFFHQSGIRTRELKDIGQQNNAKVLSFPKYFEIRWAEFTSDLLNSILSSWRALVLYFDKFKDEKEAQKECDGYYTFLTHEDNLKLICWVADVLAVFSFYQKKMQADTVTILDIKKFTESVKKQLQNLKTNPLLGGWLSTLYENLKSCNEDDGTKQLLGIKLQEQTKKKRRKTHHLYVTENRSPDAVINDTIETLKNYLDEKFSIDESVITATEPFVTLQPNADLMKVHEIWGTDLDLQSLGQEYADLMAHDDIVMLRAKPLVDLMRYLRPSKFYVITTIVLARILAAKPHSADVERLISRNNLLKTSLRNSLDLNTENMYLFVHYNMPPLQEWNPRPAIISWMKEDRRKKQQTKAKSQKWYKGIFAEAQASAKVDEDDDQNVVKLSLKKCFV